MRKVIEFFIQIAIVYWIATAVVAGVGFFTVMGYAGLGLLICAAIYSVVTEF